MGRVTKAKSCGSPSRVTSSAPAKTSRARGTSEGATRTRFRTSAAEASASFASRPVSPHSTVRPRFRAHCTTSDTTALAVGKRPAPRPQSVRSPSVEPWSRTPLYTSLTP